MMRELQNIFLPSQTRHLTIADYATRDPYFDNIMHHLRDFGYDIKFSMIHNTGAYHPFALRTEAIDTPHRQQKFIQSFWEINEGGTHKAQITLSRRRSIHENCHSFLHEIMHFYQDMHGLFFVPLKEQGIAPISLDAPSTITAYLFCEAWAQTEAIRTSWALHHKGYDMGWRGALLSPEWSALSTFYDTLLNNGIDEEKAAADTFTQWYRGKHRIFYEKHAYNIHNKNDTYLYNDVNLTINSKALMTRKIDIKALLSRLPQTEIPPYFTQIDWSDPLYAPSAYTSFDIESDNTDIQDIKCGSPPYLWNRLRIDAQKNGVPPP